MNETFTRLFSEHRGKREKSAVKQKKPIERFYQPRLWAFGNDFCLV